MILNFYYFNAEYKSYSILNNSLIASLMVSENGHPSLEIFQISFLFFQIWTINPKSVNVNYSIQK